MTQPLRITIGRFSMPVTPDTAPQTAGAPASSTGSRATPVAAPTPSTATPPGVIVADADAPPLTPSIRYRVWREMADPTRPYFQDRFYVQTSTLAAAAEIEALLELYDGWQDRAGDHDIETWEGTEWSEGLSPDDTDAARSYRDDVDTLAYADLDADSEVTQ